MRQLCFSPSVFSPFSYKNVGSSRVGGGCGGAGWCWENQRAWELERYEAAPVFVFAWASYLTYLNLNFLIKKRLSISTLLAGLLCACCCFNFCYYYCCTSFRTAIRLQPPLKPRSYVSMCPQPPLTPAEGTVSGT